MGLISVLGLAVFALFRIGSDQFKVGVVRSDLQGQGRRSITLLQKEFRRSSAATVAVVPGGDAANPRDSLSFATLSDWNDPALFEPIGGMPDWDRYYFFFVTDEMPLGRLGYATVTPSGGDAATPWPGMATYLPLSAPPAVAGELTRVSLLANSVRRFGVTQNDDRWTFDLVLEGQSLDTRRRQEDLQFRFTLSPFNS